MMYKTTWDVQIVVVKRGKPSSKVSERLNEGYEIRGFTADCESHSVLLVKKTLPKSPE